MLDALGFRGIWQRNTADSVIERLEALRTAGNGAIDRMLGGDRKLVFASPFNALKDVRLSFLSDTIAIGVEVKPEVFLSTPSDKRGPLRDATTIYLATLIVGAVLQEALAVEPRLIFRGCIALGDFEMSDSERFIVGEAVDRAAELHERAQGAFVWLAPEASEAMRSSPHSNLPSLIPAAIRHAVPMKGGDVYDTMAVFPYGPAASRATRVVARERTIEAFRTSKAFDVAVKMQNTVRFLDRVDELLTEDEEDNKRPAVAVKAAE